MKMSKRITAILLGLMMLLPLLPTQALAAGSLDTEREVSLTISAQDGDAPLAGEQFDLYLIAEIDRNGGLTAAESFGSFDFNIAGENDEAWKALASTLVGYVLRDNVTPSAGGVTDEQGLLNFAAGELEQGLYLGLADTHKQDGKVYETAPFLVLLPAFDGESGEWSYDQRVHPKLVSTPEDVPEPVDLKVLKVWKDDGNKDKRPESITIQLLRDGEVYETVTLNAKNNWRYTWSGLESGHRWNVVESKVADYSVQITQEGITFVVTNTYKTPDNPPANPPANPPSKPPKLPQTGQYWWPVPVLMTSGLLLVVLGLVRRRGGTDYEK